jgi:hypothetical protein
VSVYTVQDVPDKYILKEQIANQPGRGALPTLNPRPVYVKQV